MWNLTTWTGFYDPLDLLSSEKKWTWSQLIVKYRQLWLSLSKNNSEQSDEYKLRTFFRWYDQVIIDFLQYIQDNNLDYQDYSRKVFAYKTFFNDCSTKLYKWEMTMEDFLWKIDVYEQELIEKQRLSVFANSMNVLSNR